MKVTELFDNSVLSYHFWSDSIDDEGPEQLRLASAEVTAHLEDVATRKRAWNQHALVSGLVTALLLIATFALGNKDVGQDTSEKYGQVLGLLALTCILGLFFLAALVMRSEYTRLLRRPFSQRLRANSQARFTSWLADVETRNPKFYRDIIEWFKAEARRAEEVRRRHSQTVSMGRGSDGGGAIDRREEARLSSIAQAEKRAAWNEAMHDVTGLPEADRTRIKQESANQAEAQRSQLQSYSQSNCSQPSCTQEPMNQFAGQELCGGHTLVIIDPNNEVHGAGYGPWD